MHHPTHDAFLDTRLDPAALDADLQHALSVLDPSGHVRAEVRPPRPPERPALEALTGRPLTLLVLASMTPHADASALICALVHALRKDPDAWIRLASVEGTLVDLHPRQLGLLPLPERPTLRTSA